MYRSKYCFAGVRLELKSDAPLGKEGYYSLFSDDFDRADYSLRLIEADSLPTPCDNLIFKSDRQALYKGENELFYTVYYDTKTLSSDYGVCKVDNSEMYLTVPDGLREMVIFDALDLPSMLLHKGVGIVHSSFIEYGGQAILFVGDKQVGKSTQAALWEKYKDARVLNGDRAAVYFENRRLFADGIPFCGTSKICENKKLPVRAIVCPEKALDNRIKSISGIAAFLEILGKFSYNNLPENVEKMTDLVALISENIPIYKLSCTKDERAVECLYNALFGE